MINNKLKKYINNLILPMYKKNDSAHGIEHAKYVIKRSVMFARKNKVNINIAYTAAAFHDIGHNLDTKSHELISADIFISDIFLKTFFNEDSRNLIFKAILEHRASYDNDLTSIYSKIISTADRTTNIKKAIQRSIEYNLKQYPKHNVEFYSEIIFEFLINKYGKNGYSKIHLNDYAYNKFIKEIQLYLLDKDKFNKTFNNLYKKILKEK